jgi:hypothetical protein
MEEKGDPKRKATDAERKDGNIVFMIPMYKAAKLIIFLEVFL